ncbi:hypothetical protein L873DRAFT_788419 [Choiromyces venosus 120613-1]|uniref:Uncharacterized protein n=1 Tax=Choiromyces venosus 120613-1 TaxID=1336337 RepID=A0A3N4K484_9PEZI|nr:hypothetical protein L873DRAFT_788419 [Choiromyces venosus 120613-1]
MIGVTGGIESLHWNDLEGTLEIVIYTIVCVHDFISFLLPLSLSWDELYRSTVVLEYVSLEQELTKLIMIESIIAMTLMLDFQYIQYARKRRASKTVLLRFVGRFQYGIRISKTKKKNIPNVAQLLSRKPPSGPSVARSTNVEDRAAGYKYGMVLITTK